ncbi:T9SS type B sorting domain-containing protein [uncultured Algibacter sp.]|uniref:T9SS type B sorting domain-containing protein n=1 Tax=uncultured Algibacter sp. TaxID=298659 RepID=UPI0026035D3C|nr:T9SS type B sorting domain-containing protein [uncultured Algibacter sp.]
MKFVYYILFVFLCCNNLLFSQQITIDDSVGLDALIQDNLVDGCAVIDNISSPVNGSANGFTSYGYFERSGSSFPFEKGIVLSTGGAASGGNAVRTPTLSEGSTTWGTDPDLEAALGTTNGFVNATAIEFDFTSTSNQFRFNYLVASEEYDDVNPCSISDSFVFLIKRAGTADPYTNLATVPGTSTPIQTSTIHNIQACPGGVQNEQFFEGYAIGDTNFNGRTTVLSASGKVEPNETYHIKLIIADQADSTVGAFDTAVFIEGDSFRVLDLGDDISTCAGSVELNADIENAFASYAWYHNGVSIPNPDNDPTLLVTDNGTYRVEVAVPLNGTNCVEDDEIIVELNATESIDPISDYELCEDSGAVIFDLTTKNPELNIPFTNYGISYHYSETEARSNSNEITLPIGNPPNGQEIFVRVQDTDSNCFAFTSFDLIINSKPNIPTITPLTACDGDSNPDGFTVIDLTQKTDEIVKEDPSLVVTYHLNATDAANGTDAETLIVNSSSSQDIYVRVLNTVTNCFNTATFQVNTEISPEVNRDPQFINACDSDLDGNAFFDLTQVIAPILNGLTGVSTTFHESFDHAESNTDPIPNESNYEYTNAVLEPGSATLYLRIEDDVTGCASIIPFEIHTNLLLTGTDVGDFAICDDNTDPDDAINFNLFVIETSIANEMTTDNGLPNNIEVTFYRTPEDRDSGNALDKSLPFNAFNPQVVYVEIDDGAGCKEETDITLIINPILLFEEKTLPYCDDDDDGIVQIDLTSLDDIINDGNSDFEVTYFENQTDADGNINPLPQFYENTDPVTELFARITSPGAVGCHTVNPFKIEVITAPSANTPVNIVLCDNFDGETDGFVEVNLNNKISDIVSSTVGLDIDFFTSFDDADTKTNEIPESERDTYNTNTQTIFVRIEDIVSNTNCYNIVSFETFINTEPIIPNNIEFQICKTDGSDVADFILSEIDEDVLNGQTGKEVFYFEDAAFTMPIPKDVIYNNISREQTIHVRVENTTDPTCFDTGNIQLIVSPAPDYNPVIDFVICDDSGSSGEYELDLNKKIAELSEGFTGDDLNISFHISPEDADNNENSLPDPYSFTNTSKTTETIYIRIENDNSLCHVVEPINILITAIPSVLVGNPSITNCADTFGGNANFDLTAFNLLTQTPDFQIIDRLRDILIINYYNELSDINEDDGRDASNEIIDPSNFTSASKTIYFTVTNPITGCYTLVPLELLVNNPPQFTPIDTIPICDNDTDTYDLSLVNNMIVDDSSLVNISYHSTNDDAENNVFPLGNTYNYTSSVHTIHLRLEDVSNGCFTTTSFNLQINPNPVATIPPDLISCDDDFDGFFAFNLTENTNNVLGTLSQSLYTVTYFDAIANAEENTNALNAPYSAKNGDIIYARLENNNTGCYDITQFNIIVHPLPVIPINDVVPLCDGIPISVDAYTGDPNDVYLWSTNVNPPVNNSSSSEIFVTPNELGDYSVTVTTANNCSYTKTFTVIESEQAEIEFTSTVDFQDPNSITVDINLGRIGNYVYVLDGGNPQTSNVFDNVSFGMHVVTVRDLNGCMDISKEVFVFDIPKFVTPNGDGIYDTWHVTGANQLPGTIVYIYDRYGKLLKTLPHNSTGWNGNYNGQKMPSDDYWFLASIVQDGNTFQIKGHFALKR